MYRKYVILGVIIVVVAISLSVIFSVYQTIEANKVHNFAEQLQKDGFNMQQIPSSESSMMPMVIGSLSPINNVDSATFLNQAISSKNLSAREMQGQIFGGEDNIVYQCGNSFYFLTWPDSKCYCYTP